MIGLLGFKLVSNGKELVTNRLFKMLTTRIEH